MGDTLAYTRAILSRRTGETLAGHLDNAAVFASEVHLRIFEESQVRASHEATGLDLWLSE